MLSCLLYVFLFFSINVCLILYSVLMKFYLVNFKLFYEKKKKAGGTRGLSPKIAKHHLLSSLLPPSLKFEDPSIHWPASSPARLLVH